MEPMRRRLTQGMAEWQARGTRGEARGGAAWWADPGYRPGLPGLQGPLATSQ